ncbi:MAG TPA: ABC transporter substrate-binding protein [Acidimicrobiia bacterium]|jgi:peptide/nickel transport system substrate-binding protein|nr:ABC transporter substrate-binding protein [Acidimicrobiia bacterium]
MRPTRSSKPPRRFLFLLILVLALVAAACSGDDDDAGGEDAGGETTTTAAADAGSDDGGDAGDDGDTGSDSGDASGAEVSNPGVFVHAADDEPTTLDPAQVEPGEGGETVILQVYDRLLEIGMEGPDPIPGLATEVPSISNGLISEDGLTYTFQIREGVTFHDGSPLTADDVLFSWDRVMTMDLPDGAASVLSDTVASMRVVDESTFEVTLQEPNAAFLNAVVPAMVSSIVSQEAVEANGGVVPGEPNEFLSGNPVGTGPYSFVAWNRGENLQFEVYDGYWGTPANLDLRIEIGASPDIRVLGLRAGDFDTIETDPSFIGDIEGAEGVTIFAEGLTVEPIHIAFNMRFDPADLPDADNISADFFQDPRVRQAFNYAFDYEAFLNGALGGFGDFNPHYIPQGIFGYDPNAPVYNTQDLARAEELFREAGVWDTGFSISVVTEEANLFEVAALVLKDSIDQLGNPNLSITVASVAEAVFDEAHASDPVPYAMWVKNADPFADPHAYVDSYTHPDGEWGVIHGFRDAYVDPDAVASLIDQAKVELDPAVRAALYSELQALLFDDPMWIIAAQEGVVAARRDWVQGFVSNPLWPRPSLKFALMDK